MFFMLTRKEKWYQTMAQVVGPRTDPAEFSNRLASMVRRFMLGNLLAGTLMVTVALLLVLRIQGALALGVVSGFLNLIPFLGVVLAALIPMAAALVQSTPASTLLIIGFALILIHLLSSNFLSPISMVHV
jgi:predicted PurR-regulated permease PerM